MRERLLREVKEAILEFCLDPNAYKLLPEVGSNIVAALPDAKSVREVAGLSGRIVRDERRAVPVGVVKFGGSRHVARVVLAAMSFDPSIRAGMNVKYSREALKACEELGLSSASFDRRLEPKGRSTMDWGTRDAIKSCGFVPDIIYDKGWVGKEPMIRVLGKNPKEVVGKALRIASLL